MVEMRVNETGKVTITALIRSWERMKYFGLNRLLKELVFTKIIAGLKKRMTNVHDLSKIKSSDDSQNYTKFIIFYGYSGAGTKTP